MPECLHDLNAKAGQRNMDGVIDSNRTTTEGQNTEHEGMDIQGRMD